MGLTAMAATQAMLLAAGGALAAYAVTRSESAAGAPSDFGYTSVAVTKPLSHSEPAVRRGLSVPCGASRVPFVDLPLDGRVGKTLAVEWASECRSLVAKFGSDTFIGVATGRPKISAACALEWIDQWLDAWFALYKAEPIRYAVGPLSETVTDPRELPERSVTGIILGGDAITRLGLAWRALLKQRNLAQWLAGGGDPDKVYLHSATASSAVKELALALDARAAAELSGNAGEEALELAKGAAKGAAGAVAWVAEEVLGPLLGSVVGSVVGAVLPFVVIGGVLYIVVRRSS